MAEPAWRPSLPQETGKRTGSDAIATSSSKKSPSPSINRLKHLQPDYVISVKLTKDNARDFDNVEKLVKALVSQGLKVEVRQGCPGSVLVFIQCTQSRLAAQVEKCRVNDWLFGVRNENPADDKISSEGFSSAERLRLVYDIITSPSNNSGLGIKPGQGDWKFVQSVFALHDAEWNREWLRRFSTPWLIEDKEIRLIRQQFGDRVAMYFAFVQYYFLWSLFPTGLGVASHYIFGAYSSFFAALNCIWGIAFVYGWIRRENQLAIQWGVKNSSVLETRRIEFQGDTEIMDSVTGLQRPYYAKWKQGLKMVSFVPVAMGSALILMLFQSCVFVIEIFMVQIYDGPFQKILTQVPTLLLVGVTPFISLIYGSFVNSMTDWENHETEDSWTRSFIRKKFVFYFLTAYMGLFLSAYVYLPFGHLIVPHLELIQLHVENWCGFAGISSNSSFELNSKRLQEQVVFVVSIAQVISFMMETVVPYILRMLTTRARTYATGELIYNDEPEEAKFLQSVREQSELPVYSVHEDYRQLALQFGFTILFGPVWSLAPLFATINNWVQIRGDAAKICFDFQRPAPERAETIGQWVDNLKFLTWVGSITCSSIIAMFAVKGDSTNGGLVATTPKTVLLAVLVSEHLYFLVSRIIQAAFSLFESQESVQYKQHRYTLRKKYLAEKREKIEQFAPLSVENKEVGSIVEQVKKALVPPQTLKDKKNR